MSIEKVYIDTKDVAAKMSFLVGKTILFRDAHEDATIATSILAVKSENISGEKFGGSCVSFYTTVGVERFTNSRKFNNIMVLESDGSLKCLGDYTDQMGIVF